MEDIEHYGIAVYNFPFDVEEDDEDTIADNSDLRKLMPFAIVGSEDEVNINGELVRARTYPWGAVEVMDPRHSDFSRLRSALLNTHLTDLKEITHDFLYENYRTEKVSRATRRLGSGMGEERHQLIITSRLLCSPQLSRTVHSDYADAPIPGDELANQSVKLKEEQLRREEEKLREIELKVQREIQEKRQELQAKEESLRNLESRLAAQGEA